MGLKECCYNGKRTLDLRAAHTSARQDGADKEQTLRRMQKNLSRIAALQDKLFADGREGIVVILQAMDAAGKDSTIKHVMGCVNPQGIDVVSFKQPSGEELAHDYLWRAHRAVPARGKMAIFNRSYYEDVLVVRVHDLQKGYQMADRCIDEKDRRFFELRYRQIRDFEEYLYENSYRVVKIFLHVSQEKQKERFLERIDRPEKNWKFSESDLRERAHWNEYMNAYQDAINATATKHSPWYVVPADQKWYARYLVSEAILEALEAADPQYPKLSEERREHLAECKEKLLAEAGGQETE